MTSRFDLDTAVEPTGQDSAVAKVAHGWDVIDDGPPNGGYLMAIALRAMKQRSGHPHVATATTHFLRPVVPGPVAIDTAVVKVGRRLTTVGATLRQDGTACLRVVAAFGDLATEGVSASLRAPLDLPPPQDCIDLADDPHGFTSPPIAHRAGLRLVPEDTAWAGGAPTGTGVVRGWGRFENGRPMDDLGLAVLCDAFPPAVFNAGLPIAWAPTVELTLHVRHPGPIAEPIACRFQSTWATGGFVEEDGIMELADGTPVAMSRQLLLAPRR